MLKIFSCQSRTRSAWSFFPGWRDLNLLLLDDNHHFLHTTMKSKCERHCRDNGRSPLEVQPEEISSAKTGNESLRAAEVLLLDENVAIAGH
jgi:hypothetical protein